MIIGLDLDNTIVCYDAAIEHLASDMESLPPDVPKTKLGVRDYLRAEGREPEWTEFQGKLYGPGMAHAAPFPAALESIAAFQNAGHSTVIISHRSRYPYLGPRYDLHESAREWIGDKLLISGRSLFSPEEVHLNESRDEKIALVDSLKCDVFLDDLKEVLTDEAFPPTTKKLWFSPGSDEKAADTPDEVTLIKHWTDLTWLSSN
ncbi:MAG: hypothetical protein HN793_00845 [Rhodospirillaceae bacterium]|jgi:hypothetical protein|nr:hypothetical protein [Rhodospirillaceae bacterium]MBT5564260.1 hypothetical protein [Rhodospirillaceae bacterium]MBT6088825.1 hypothetical protein [Rhodospirillaceae bacterium]MBT6962341.1 hypothetical protein [Rhodospirillaceae bacterium]MBT7449344.1 hypothetical protein [Rhodospirillaceae bacterium]